MQLEADGRNAISDPGGWTASSEATLLTVIHGTGQLQILAQRWLFNKIVYRLPERSYVISNNLRLFTIATIFLNNVISPVR